MADDLTFAFNSEGDALLNLNDHQFHDNPTVAASARMMKHIIPVAIGAVEDELKRTCGKDVNQFRKDLIMSVNLVCVNITINMLIQIIPPAVVADLIDNIADLLAENMRLTGEKMRKEYGVPDNHFAKFLSGNGVLQ